MYAGHYNILRMYVCIARDDPSTLPGNDPFTHSRMHRDRNAW